MILYELEKRNDKKNKVNFCYQHIFPQIEHLTLYKLHVNDLIYNIYQNLKSGIPKNEIGIRLPAALRVVDRQR